MESTYGADFSKRGKKLIDKKRKQQKAGKAGPGKQAHFESTEPVQEENSDQKQP